MSVLRQTKELFTQKKELLCSLHATVGFDGYIDELFDIVQHKISPTQYERFAAIKMFGQHLSENIGSCGLEIISRGKKIGGNGPIMSKAMGTVGVHVNCIGAFGLPTLDEIFTRMPANCRLFSIAQPAYTQAFEFDDGKMMFGQQRSLDKITWQELQSILGQKTLENILANSNLIAVTNWSQLANANNLWQGILNECMPNLPLNNDRYIFFDLSDPCKRTISEIKEMIRLLYGYQKYGKIVLGLNLQEANHLYGIITGKNSVLNDTALLAHSLHEHLPLDMLVLHSAQKVSVAVTGQTTTTPCIKVKSPQSFTGCGDNFNAGFMTALLLKMPIEQATTFGSCTASYYIENGESPNEHELLAYMNEKEKGDDSQLPTTYRGGGL